MTMTIREPARDIPVRAEFDVVVVGGGIAGVAAAVAAARNGVSVCLVDKASALGGLATLGNVTIWLPLCDGHGRQVTAGMGEELLKLSVADLPQAQKAARFEPVPACWQSDDDPEARQTQRYLASFNPAVYMFALEKWVVDAGVSLLYDTRFCAVRPEDDRISHVIIENKSGRQALACRTVIDATGDADLCFLAGEQTESLDSNVACGWFYTLAEGKLTLIQHSQPYSHYARKDSGADRYFRGDNGQEVTDHILHSRSLARERLAKLRAAHPERDIQLLMPATIACFRMTRRLVGTYSLSETDMHRWFDDTIGLTGDWRKAGPVYAIPYRSIVAVRHSNLLAVGRCISADSTAWDVTRVIPPCVVTGEAAGTAAALATRYNRGNLQTLDLPQLQDQLRAQGGLLDPNLVKAVPVV